MGKEGSPMHAASIDSHITDEPFHDTMSAALRVFMHIHSTDPHMQQWSSVMAMTDVPTHLLSELTY